jgi:hypothetical protein
VASRRVKPVADVREVVAGASCRLATEGRAFLAYNQEAFHYFLALERKRAERSSRPLMLVLASVMPRSVVLGWRIEPAVAQKVFAALWVCTREADFIGWYREGQVAGAVLVHCATDSTAGVSRQVRARVTTALSTSLSRGLQQAVRVHVLRMVPAAASATPNTR